MSQNFWDNPNSADDTPVIRHAPDQNSYIYPDGRMLERMPHGRVGQFAIIPAANRDGTSKGFDIDDPGVVHVDPDAPDGGAIVDYGQVDGRQFQHALATSQHPHQVYYQIGQSPGLRKIGYDMTAAAPRTNHHIPQGGYITPAAAPGGGQMPLADPHEFLPITQVMPMQTQPLPPAPQPTAVPAAPPAPFPQQAPPQYVQQAPQQYVQQQPQYQQATPPQYAPPPYPPQYAPPQYAPPPAPSPDMLQLTQLVQGLAQTVAGMQRSAPQPLAATPGRMPQLQTVPQTLPLPSNEGPRVGTPPRRRPMVDEEASEQNEYGQVAPAYREAAPPQLRQQTLNDVEQPDVNAGVITGFETLDIPFVLGPKPEKARQRVIFEFPGVGKHSASYHAVIDSKNCVVLCYDSRYEEGSQYMPQDFGEQPVKLHVLMPGKKVKEHTVASMDMTFSCGVLDFIVLTKIPEDSNTTIGDDEDFTQNQQ